MINNENQEIGNDIKNVMNIISGMYTMPLIDKLFPTGKKLSDMEDIYSALVALAETGKVTEGMKMIRGLFGIAGIEYPYNIELLEGKNKMQEIFIAEFLEDFYEMIDERNLTQY